MGLSSGGGGMHFTFRQLQIFEAVARLLGFSRASEELHLTQPAVSMQIKQLEDFVGMPLFEQMGKRIFLTHAGEELYQHARVIARQMKDAREALESLREGISGRLDIAIIKPLTTPIFSCSGLTRGAKQLVVQEALEMTVMSERRT